VLVYDPKVNEANVMPAIYLCNTTDEVLAAGTIAVLEGARFVGQTEFCPLMPGEDQLLRYGAEAAEVSVRCAHTATVNAVQGAHSCLERPPKWEPTKSAPRYVSHVVLEHVATRSTTYTLTNSGPHPIPTLYLDHTASSLHGGYEVVTRGPACIKSVTGFARYAYRLEPGASLEVTIEERASYTERVEGPDLPRFLQSSRAKSLEHTGVLTEELLAAIQAHICLSRARRALEDIRDGEFLEADLISWLGHGETGAPLQGADGRPLFGAQLTASLEKVLQNRAAKRSSEEAARAAQAHHDSVCANQERIRKNIQALETQAGSSLVARYLKDLNREEDELALARKALLKQRAAQEKLAREGAEAEKNAAHRAQALLESVFGEP
jgi:hypothetical protein